jgi:hypothetical protein
VEVVAAVAVTLSLLLIAVYTLAAALAAVLEF